MSAYCPSCGEEPLFGPEECTACMEPCCEECAGGELICRECRKVGIT